MASALSEPLLFETFYDQYRADEIIGEGGAGRVFGARDSAGRGVAIKLLTQPSRDKQKRFKNETAFLAKQNHRNLVRVFDQGIRVGPKPSGPFYVMDRYDGNLRTWMEPGSDPTTKLAIFSQILDGVEAAHLSGAAHRDLKPENILVSNDTNQLAIADFGVAGFRAEELYTAVETQAAQRLANFEYSAPEQRRRGEPAGIPADVYALGLILNEFFTQQVAHGTSYATIATTAPDYAFLDSIVAQMLHQSPTERPSSVRQVKELIRKYRDDAVTLQRLSILNNEVVEATSSDDATSQLPSALVDARWERGQLFLTLDKPASSDWIQALHNIGSHTAVQYAGPEAFHFEGRNARVVVPAESAQNAINYFKDWLPKAAARYRYAFEQSGAEDVARRQKELRLERQAEELKLSVNRSLRI